MAFLMGFVVGGACAFFAAGNLFARAAREAAEVQARQRAADQDLLMRTFRRELANWMFKTDPDRFGLLYDRARATEAEILASDAPSRTALLKRIAEEVPYISDFDFVGAREYVQYGDALGLYSYEEVEEKYLDIVRWQALQLGHPSWRFCSKPTSDADQKYLPEYTTRFKNAEFKKRLEEAMGLYWFARRQQDSLNVDNDRFSVQLVPHFAENRYGIHLKDTDEYGLFSTFSDGDRFFENYYRSSRGFKEEKWLS